MDEEMANFCVSFFRNSMLKFFDDLFNHVLKETEGVECTPRFDDLPLVFPLYQSTVGAAVTLILDMAAPHINEFFESIKDRMQDRGSVGKFISRLGSKFLLDGKAADTLYFLVVTSKIFCLVHKENKLSLNSYIKECVNALEKTSSGPNSLAGFKDILPLVSDILHDNGSWRSHFGSLVIGDVDYYFPPATAAENI